MLVPSLVLSFDYSPFLAHRLILLLYVICFQPVHAGCSYFCFKFEEIFVFCCVEVENMCLVCDLVRGELKFALNFLHFGSRIVESDIRVCGHLLWFLLSYIMIVLLINFFSFFSYWVYASTFLRFIRFVSMPNRFLDLI